MRTYSRILLVSLILAFGLLSCQTEPKETIVEQDVQIANVLDYQGHPDKANYRESLMFSDQGAWFAYGFSNQAEAGFTGPFLMTQEQGEWAGEMLCQLELTDVHSKKHFDWQNFKKSKNSYLSHLEQSFENEQLQIKQSLFYSSAHTAFILMEIKNLSADELLLNANLKGQEFLASLHLEQSEHGIQVKSKASEAKGLIQFHTSKTFMLDLTDSTYVLSINGLDLAPQERQSILISQTFIFPEYDFQAELNAIQKQAVQPELLLKQRRAEKSQILAQLNLEMDSVWQDSIYQNLLNKTILTLQNNSRVAAGELNFAGVFPSYHYPWFLGFWAWDSWKHAVALAHYQPEFAKDQIRAMYDYQLENGFILDCIYRDTSIEQHNYRNTKPPLSAWAVWEVYEQTQDVDFVKEMYPKILKQHHWWYAYRDYDKDSICEYGSTDGTLVAAKWESGMDNAVRFDHSQMVQSAETVYSLNQESVDLNAYLYAEKNYLSDMAELLNLSEDAKQFKNEAFNLKAKIQAQFFDAKTGWFYDTSIEGDTFIEAMGCEGWIPLWAKVATEAQAEAVKHNMMNPDHFFTKVPFQTLSAAHPDFKPNRGYWRGPNWLDQAYFGVIALHNYGFHQEAYDASYRLIHNAEGVLEKGPSIRENYQPMTGEGLESETFSWSAAHYLLLLLGE